MNNTKLEKTLLTLMHAKSFYYAKEDVRIYQYIFNNDGNIVNYELKSSGWYNYDPVELLAIKLTHDKRTNSKLYNKIFKG